jgi:hypothetical protein
VAGFQAAEAKLVSRAARFGGRLWGWLGGWFGGMAGEIKVRGKRHKRYKSPFMCWIGCPLPIGTVLLRRCGDGRDGLLPTRYVLADVPYVIRGPCPLAADSVGLVSGGVVFPELSKLLHQEDALGAPCLDTVIRALRRRALAGRRNAADRRNPSLRYHIKACCTGHQAGKR